MSSDVIECFSLALGLDLGRGHGYAYSEWHDSNAKGCTVCELRKTLLGAASASLVSLSWSDHVEGLAAQGLSLPKLQDVTLVLETSWGLAAPSSVRNNLSFLANSWLPALRTAHISLEEGQLPDFSAILLHAQWPSLCTLWLKIDRYSEASAYRTQMATPLSVIQEICNSRRISLSVSIRHGTMALHELAHEAWPNIELHYLSLVIDHRQPVDFTRVESSLRNVRQLAVLIPEGNELGSQEHGFMPFLACHMLATLKLPHLTLFTLDAVSGILTDNAILQAVRDVMTFVESNTLANLETVECRDDDPDYDLWYEVARLCRQKNIAFYLNDDQPFNFRD